MGNDEKSLREKMVDAGIKELCDRHKPYLFVNIDYSSMEMRMVAKYGPLTRQQEHAAAIFKERQAAGLSVTGRMTKCQPARYFGHTYSSREFKD